MSTAYVQALTQYLAGSGVVIGATSIVLTSLTDIYGNAITSITPFGTTGYITLEPDTTNEEAAVFTSVTANANGTVTLGGVSTILAQTPYTATSGLVRAHSGGTKVVITDNVAFWATFANKANNETITGRWGSATVPSAGNDYANKTYVDGVAVAGAPNANTTTKGIVQEATQAQLLSKTASGSTGAELYVNPATMPSTLLSDYKADTGSANTYTITPAPAVTAYAVGQIFSFKAVNANTTASTLNVNALGTKTIKNITGADLVANDISAGQIVVVEYDGTNFVMISPSGNLTAKKLQSATTIVDTSAATAPSAGQYLRATGSTAATWQTLAFAKGTATKNLTDASTTQNIPHGLGVIPVWYSVKGIGPGPILAFCDSGNSFSLHTSSAVVTQTFNLTSDTGASETNHQDGVVTADATNIIITWTKVSSPTGTGNLIWQAGA